MADPARVVRQLGLQRSAEVTAKAAEFCRLTSIKFGNGGLGQYELCKGAACVELACQALGVQVDSSQVARYSAVSEKVYRAGKAVLQKALGVAGGGRSARELCVQFGCARHEQAVKEALAAFKERFVRSLPPAAQARVDFGRTVFLAAAFYLVARKHRVAVDRMKLLNPLGVTASEFAQVSASMQELCPELVGAPPGGKRQADDEAGALVERTGAAADSDEASDSEDEVTDEGQVGYRLNAKKQRQREYEAWKAKMLAKPEGGASGAAASAAGSGGGGAGSGSSADPKEQPTEKKMKQGTLCFGAATQPAAHAAAAAGKAGGSTAGKEQAIGGSKAAALATANQQKCGSKHALVSRNE
ncbi:Origin recognition complex subunit 6 [Micractinium conductrix]|uniref:Origin recognition complex subunit 6 n=1 Tax=Micractinium conductrix TaxID=554055 RepID=A0A2P6V6D7_9CHLO|nr:Origin recognition complex subunit 6 [Micractinium conductrix]|eukprot:PSC69652.1 Origin recognition complex subunit 6 [Micractinium conductrix]